MMRNYDGRGKTALFPCLLGDGSQRGPVQVVKVSVRNQHQIYGWQIAQAQTRFPQSLQDEKPGCKIWIDGYVLTSDLHKKTGVANEGHTHLPMGNQLRFVALPAAWGDCGMANQTPKLAGALAERTVL